MFRRVEAKTRAQLMRAELGETFDHARRAAGHASSGMRASVGPRVAPAADRVRSAAANGWGSTRSALNEASQQKAKMRRKQQKAARRRWSWLAGMLAGGAALGGAAAYAARRRQREQWEAYDVARPTSAAPDSPTGGTGGTTGGGDELVRETGTAVQDGRT